LYHAHDIYYISLYIRNTSFTVLTIIISFFSEIKPEFGSLFVSLCEEQCLMYIQCEEVKERKRQRKVETEVADLRYNSQEIKTFPFAKMKL
jgi:hypothetical protein